MQTMLRQTESKGFHAVMAAVEDVTRVQVREGLGLRPASSAVTDGAAPVLDRVTRLGFATKGLLRPSSWACSP